MALPLVMGCGAEEGGQGAGVDLTDTEVENIVRRSYQYVALYNVINKAVFDSGNPMATGGWNKMNIASQLMDHNLKSIARPNNDSFYITCMLDLRKGPVVLDIPAFDSKYVSLMPVAYDHYVNVAMSTRLGDFVRPEKVLFYTARTEGYDGEEIDGISRTFEMSGDFVIAVIRVTPHANEPERFERIRGEMKMVRLMTLSEYQGGEATPADDIEFPDFGLTDADVFENNLLEVMQFVFNHTTFDPGNEIDQGVLAAYKPLGVEPGKKYDPSAVAGIDGRRFRKASEDVARQSMAVFADPEAAKQVAPRLAQPKGKADLEAQVILSVVGPIGLPREEAMYSPVVTADGKTMNAMNDYVIRMTEDELPPAKAFWSLTLYDKENGFFIPNDRKKYSVGENGGMELNENGGIEIYVAAEKPAGVPEDNWLPINRGDEDLDIILRMYVPELEKVKTWSPPTAEKL